MFSVIHRASSLVSSLAAERRPGMPTSLAFKLVSTATQFLPVGLLEEKCWRKNVSKFVLLDPRAPSRAVVRTVAGEDEDLADMLPGDVDAVVGELQALAQRRLGGRGLGHEANIARGQRQRTICGRLSLQSYRRSNSGSLAMLAAMPQMPKKLEARLGFEPS